MFFIFNWRVIALKHCIDFCHEKVKVIVAQSCLTLCNSMDCNLPSSSVHGILQARILEYFIIQRIFLTQGSKPRSPALQADSLHLSHLHQHESATDIHMYPLSWTSLPPPTLSNWCSVTTTGNTISWTLICQKICCLRQNRWIQHSRS